MSIQTDTKVRELESRVNELEKAFSGLKIDLLLEKVRDAEEIKRPTQGKGQSKSNRVRKKG